MKWIQKIILYICFVLCLCMGLSACSTTKSAETSIEYLIGVSFANIEDPWQLELSEELLEEASQYPNLKLIFLDATNSSNKQKSDIALLQEYGVDLLIVSPTDVDEMEDTINEVYQQDMPIILLDRAVEGYNYTLFIGPDNEYIGKTAAEEIVNILNGKGHILEIIANSNSIMSTERSQSASSVFKLYPDITRLTVQVQDGSRDQTEEFIEKNPQILEHVDFIFAHDDYMALGAYRALVALGMEEEIKIIGIDGFEGEDGGIDLVERGVLHKSFTCPTGGKEAITNALDILNNVDGVPKQIILRSDIIQSPPVEKIVYFDEILPPEELMVGYSQTGTESAWRIANSNSIKTAATDLGFDITIMDAQNDIAKQHEDIQHLIDIGCDVIVISPIIATDWEETLTKCKDAGIPIIMSDRNIDIADESLYLTFIGGDFVEEGRRAANWMVDTYDGGRILEMQGTIGADPTVERHAGMAEILEKNQTFSHVGNIYGDYSTSGGYESMKSYLSKYGLDFDILYSHNDDMAIGALNALKEAGFDVTEDLVVISIDGGKEAVQKIIDGEIACVIECTPTFGPQLMKVVKDVTENKEIPLRIITDEKVFTAENAQAELPHRTY